MGKSWRAICVIFLCPLLAPAPSQAAVLRVKADAAGVATGYYLVPEIVLRDISNPRLVIQKVRTFTPHALTTTPYLPVGTYFVYPECGEGQLRLFRRRISENEGEVQLRCQ